MQSVLSIINLVQLSLTEGSAVKFLRSPLSYHHQVESVQGVPDNESGNVQGNQRFYVP